MLQSLPASVQRLLIFILPPISLFVCCLVLIPRHNKVREVHDEIAKTRASIQTYIMQLNTIKELPPSPKIATLPMDEQEQSDFLRGINTLCSRTNNRMISITSLAAPKQSPPPPPPAPAGGANAQKKAAPKDPSALPPDVIEIKTTLIFEGSFHSLRSFLFGLQRSQRLISLSDCRIGIGEGGYPNLQTALTIVRFVDAPNSAGAPKPAPATQSEPTNTRSTQSERASPSG
jgi:hypothetical protein